MPSFTSKPSIGVVNGDEQMWLVDDPSGTPADVKASVDTVLARTLALPALAELIRDTIGTALVAGSNVTITPNDAGDTITIASTGGGATDQEVVRDTIATALVAGANITITPNDAADTITIAVSGVQAADATLGALAALTGAGVVTATGTDNFAMRAIGAAASTDIPDRAAADARYAPLAAVSAAPKVTTVTGNTTLGLSHIENGFGIVEVDSASAVALTVPQNVFALHDTIKVRRIGTGAVTIVTGSGVTFQPSGTITITNQFGSASVSLRATNTWIVE